MQKILKMFSEELIIFNYNLNPNNSTFIKIKEFSILFIFKVLGFMCFIIIW